MEKIPWPFLEKAAMVDPEWIATKVGQSILNGNEIIQYQERILKDLPTAFKDQIEIWGLMKMYPWILFENDINLWKILNQTCCEGTIIQIR